MKVNDFILMLNKPNFIAPRRMGKTYETIKYCYEHKIDILAGDHNRVSAILDQISSMAHAGVIQGVINKKTNALMDTPEGKDIFRVVSILDEGVVGRSLFVDELGYMNIEDVLRVMEHNRIEGYNGTMAQANMKIWKMYDEETLKNFKEDIGDNEVYEKEILMKF